MTRDIDARLDAEYVRGYEQAYREWIACVSESGRISEANITRRAQSLEAVRRGRKAAK